MKFLDQAKIYLKSGNGGAGCISFRREKYVEYGGPDGGNGGRGGHIYFECVENLNTLIDFRYQQHFKADTGGHGQGRNRSGKDGADLIVKVPIGTELLDEDKETVLHDFTTAGERILFLRGGDGGFGNNHYKTPTHQAPRRSSPGWPGQEVAVWLRLKLIADAGLLGMPNAGKSTFLAACSRAKPKIADYPFTTLHPNLGVVKVGSYDFVLADIPGLIEGAHEGHGLGHRFLGHVERTSILLHLVDITQDDFVENYFTIQNELEAYSPDLAKKEQIVALNKIDALTAEERTARKKKFKKKTNIEPMMISAVSGENVEKILFKLGEVIYREKQKLRDAERENIAEDIAE